MRCLQLGPDDDEEAQRLRERGHACAVLIGEWDPYQRWDWHESPVLADWRRMPWRDATFDLIFSPWFGRLAAGPEEVGEVARRLYAALKPGGGMLLSMSNRWCPLDLIDKRIQAPGTGIPVRLGLADVERAFRGTGARIDRKNVRGHFRWGRLPRSLAWLGPALNLYLGAVSSTWLRPLYASPLNPVLMIWTEKPEDSRR